MTHLYAGLSEAVGILGRVRNHEGVIRETGTDIAEDLGESLSFGS